jgi:hypothetical protein
LCLIFVFPNFIIYQSQTDEYIEIAKFTSKGQSKESTTYKILNYKTIAQPELLLLVSEGTMSNEDRTESAFLEIMKVQFIASCKTDFSEEPILAAFYMGEGSELYPYIIDQLPGGYYQDGQSFRLVDYKSYTEICAITGETAMPLAEYILELKSAILGANTLLYAKEKFLNYDEQKKYYSELDQNKPVK